MIPFHSQERQSLHLARVGEVASLIQTVTPELRPLPGAWDLAHSRCTVTCNHHCVCETSPLFVMGLKTLKGESPLITTPVKRMKYSS